jgi:hypothetical protein
MQRRSFLGSILALAAAPAIVRADSLMRVIPLKTSILIAEDITTTLTPFTLSAFTPGLWSREVLRVLHQNLAFADNINKRYDTSWNSAVVNGEKTLEIRRPQRFMVN